MSEQRPAISAQNSELQRISQPPEKVAIIDKIAKDLSLSDTTKGWLARLLPDRLEKIRKLSNERVLTTELQLREAIFEDLSDARRQAAEEHFKHILIVGKGVLRGDAAVQFASKLAQVKNDLQLITRSFEKNTQKTLREIEKIEYLRLKEKSLEQLDLSIDSFFESIRKLETDFEQILDTLKKGS